LSRCTSSTDKFSTFTWLKLDVVDNCTNWDVCKWKSVTNLDIRIWT
jgi:hypothetical protein